MQSILRLSEILTIELQIPVFTDIEKRHRDIEKSPENQKIFPNTQNDFNKRNKSGDIRGFGVKNKLTKIAWQ